MRVENTSPLPDVADTFILEGLKGVVEKESTCTSSFPDNTRLTLYATSMVELPESSNTPFGILISYDTLPIADEQIAI